MIVSLLLALAAQDTSRLTLAAAVERALARHPSVAAARAARQRAAAEVGEARAQRLPRLALDATLTQWQEPALVYPFHSFDPQQQPTFDRATSQASATLSWTLSDFGARAARVSAAREQAGAADAALDAAEQALVARTATTYLRVLTARQTLAAQDQRLAALAAEAERARRLLAEGKAARVEVLRVDAERARAEADRIGTATQLEVAQRELAQLVGAPPAEPMPVVLRDTAAVTRQAALDAAVAASPDLAESRRRAAAARRLERAARAARWPELRLASAYVERGRDAFGALRGEWQAGLGLTYPLWTGGQRASQIRRADADARVAAEQLRLVELTVALQVDRALAALREAHARVAALMSAAEQSREVARIERLSLEVGSGTQTDYLEAEAALLRARASLIESRYAEIAARVELARVTGRLSATWLALSVE